MTTVTAALLDPLLSADPHHPRVIAHCRYGTQGHPGRTELSTASLANWSAKVAGLLRDELGGEPGDLVFVGTPAGWQTAAILLGVWWAGLVVTDQDDPAALAAFVPDPGNPWFADGRPAGAGPKTTDRPASAADPGGRAGSLAGDAGNLAGSLAGGLAGDPGTAEARGRSDEVFVVSGHPLGAPSLVLRPHQRDFTGAVLPQADRFRPSRMDGAAPALAGTAELSVARALALARAGADLLGPGSRVLSASPWRSAGTLALLGGTLLAGGSLIQVDPADPGISLDGIAASEKADVTAGSPPVDVPGRHAVDLSGLLDRPGTMG